MISRHRIKGSQKQQMRTLARDIILKAGATSTWVDFQKATLDGTLEAQIREATSKIQPIRDVMIRRTQLMQSGVVAKDGPTLEQVIEDERAAQEEAKSVNEEIGDDEEIEVELSLEEEVLEVEEEESGESAAEVDYESMTVAQLKELLKQAGKPVSGKKAELIERLKE